MKSSCNDCVHVEVCGRRCGSHGNFDRAETCGCTKFRVKITPDTSTPDTKWNSAWNGVDHRVYVYQRSIVTNCTVVETLGAIREVCNGLWHFWRWPSKFFPGWLEGGGSASSGYTARQLVEEGWS